MEKSEMNIIDRHLRQAPVDLKSIFSALGIEYDKDWDSSASGSITRRGDKFVISVNGHESENRQRFTAAHELAHYILHRDLMGDGKRMHRHVDNLYGAGASSGDVLFKPAHEVEANRIAAQIIMPKKLVEQEHAKTPGAAILATKFGVSKAAMEIRLKTLGLTN